MRRCPFYIRCLACIFVNRNYCAVELHILLRHFKSRRKLCYKTRQNLLDFSADNGIVRACHADVGQVSRPFRIYPFVRRLNVRVRT